MEKEGCGTVGFSEVKSEVDIIRFEERESVSKQCKS